METFLKIISGHPYYKVEKDGTKPIIVFEDHRFVVPILWLARKEGIVNGPANMVRFDGHYDALDYPIESGREFGGLKDFGAVFHFCENKLGHIDDDWQGFVLDQKMVDKVLIFCERKDDLVSKYREQILRVKGVDGVWADEGAGNIVGWKNSAMNASAVLFDIDCDYFTYQWRGQILPWQKEFYEKEFSLKPEVDDWSNRSFVEALIQKAPFVTICLEPDFCGGKENSKNILDHLNKMLFNV